MLTMKNARILTIFASTTVIIVVLFFITNIVLAIPEKGYFVTKRTSFTDLQNLNSNLTFKLNGFIRNEDVRQTVEFSGYAYFEPTTSKVINKEISLILSSSEETYLIETDLSDVFYLRDQLAQSKVEGTTHGFQTIFSPLGMANGTYELYIYCYENEDNVGYIKTDKVFIKHYGEFLEQGSISPEGQN